MLARGQTEVCPHTAAIERYLRHKKTPEIQSWALRANFYRVPTPGHGIDRDAADSNVHTRYWQ